MDKILQHGRIIHTVQEQDDCKLCIEVNLEYYQNLKEAGGITKFLKKLGKQTKDSTKN